MYNYNFYYCVRELNTIHDFPQRKSLYLSWKIIIHTKIYIRIRSVTIPVESLKEIQFTKGNNATIDFIIKKKTIVVFDQRYSI